MKMAATASYSAVPSMLMVAPMGRTNLEILGSTPFFCSRQFMVTGREAELEAVPQAVIMAWPWLAMNLQTTCQTRTRARLGIADLKGSFLQTMV